MQAMQNWSQRWGMLVAVFGVFATLIGVGAAYGTVKSTQERVESHLADTSVIQAVAKLEATVTASCARQEHMERKLDEIDAFLRKMPPQSRAPASSPAVVSYSIPGGAP